MQYHHQICTLLEVQPQISNPRFRHSPEGPVPTEKRTKVRFISCYALFLKKINTSTGSVPTLFRPVRTHSCVRLPSHAQINPYAPSIQTLRRGRTKGAQQIIFRCAPFCIGFMASLRGVCAVFLLNVANVVMLPFANAVNCQFIYVFRFYFSNNYHT